MRRESAPAARVVALAAVALLCVPILVDLARSPRERPFGYAAADTFYYLNVARNIARSGLPTYDGERLANGFHPVWQAICAIAYAGADWLGQARHIVLVVVLIDLALVAGAVWLLGHMLTAADRRLTPLFLLLPVGLYGMCVAPLWIAVLDDLPKEAPLEGSLPVYGTLWSFANGMESGPLLFCFALSGVLFLRARSRPSRRAAAYFGGSLSLFALSRLDHALIALPVAAAFVLERIAVRARREAVEASAWFLGPFGAYLLVNELVFGSIVPVSGAMKSTFPLFTAEHVQHLLDLFARDSLDHALAIAFREAQIFLPALAAAGYLLATVRVRVMRTGLHVHLPRSAAPCEAFLVPVALGVIVLAAYDALFVPAWVQGQWYAPVSALFVSLAALGLVERVPGRAPAFVALPLALAAAIGTVVFFVRLHVHDDHHAKYASFYWHESALVRAHYGEDIPRLLEYDDGIASFSLDFPVTSGGLVLDPEAAQAQREHRLYRLAYSRGFDCIASLMYHPAQRFLTDRRAQTVEAYAKQMVGAEDLRAFDFTLDYLSPSGSFAIIRGRHSAERATPAP